jgi:hypothetical protein
MGNTTKYLKTVPMEALENIVVKDEIRVSFADEAVASGGTLDLFTVPAGSYILGAGVYAIHGETSVTATMGTDGDSGNNDILAAIDVGTTGNSGVFAGQTIPPVFCPAQDVIRSAIGGANATDAILTYWIVYTVVKQLT